MAADAAAGVNCTSGYNSNANSRPVSRSGSVNRGRRSPSLGRQLAEHWNSAVEQASSRPQSRAADGGHKPGRVNVTQWETFNEHQPVATKTPPPPPKRRELSAPSPIPRDDPQPLGFGPSRENVNETVQWPPRGQPEPPPRTTYPANTVREENVLSPVSIQILSERAEEAKEQSVEEWVRQTSITSSRHHHHQEADHELEKFAMDVAETVVSNMEKSLTQSKVKTRRTSRTNKTVCTLKVILTY